MSPAWTRITMTLFLAGFLPAGADALEPQPVSRSRVEVDIEDLDAEIRWDGEKWRLVVEYDVEIEHASAGDSFDLVLNLFNKSRPDQPVQIVVPLTQPSEVDDDELEYESNVVARLDPNLVIDPHKLRLCGLVVRRGGGEIMDEKTTSVDCKR